ncbi:MAG: hypothetical protein GC193_01525 [Cryomorphaceae bacterium]|nr:hypothetical protein [Cryomorphaceae bacterium]
MKYLLFLFSFTIGVQLFAQSDVRGTPEWYKATAVRQISDLKSGVLLFRLPQNKVALQAARDSGFVLSAARMERQLHERNIEIVEHMRKYFTFCDVYFIYADQSEKVLAHEWNDIEFLSDSLKVDKSIHLPDVPIFTAELTLLRADTARIATGEVMRHNNEGDLKNVQTYTSSPDPMFEALIIKSDQFVQLHKPFPYYSRTFNSMPFRRSMKKVVKMMDENLERFFKSVN